MINFKCYYIHTHICSAFLKKKANHLTTFSFTELIKLECLYQISVILHLGLLDIYHTQFVETA